MALPPESGKSLRLRDEEWVLLLDLYLRRRPRTISADDSEVVELSRLLADASIAQSPGDQPRSPDGLRGRISVFRTLDPTIETLDKRQAHGATKAWTTFAGDPERLHIEALAIRAHLSRPASNNPDWNWDETVLALRTFLRLKQRYASETTPDIQSLSATLRRLGDARGAGGAPSFRNPAGVARKVNKFHAAQSGEGPQRVRGAKLEAVVWRRFRADPDELERVAEAIIGGGTSHGSGLGAAPSRGPVPKFGPRLSNLEDGQTCVYLMELRGSVDILFPEYAAAGLTVIKAGRSNDAKRRVNELNVGFPPTCDLAWALYDERMFDTGQAAHDAERRLLDHLFDRGLTLGGEFACCPKSELRDLLLTITATG